MPDTVMPQQRPIGPDEYTDMVGRIRSVIETSVPPGSVVLVISKGDDALLELASWRGWHYPQDGSGGYPGYTPSDSDAAIRHLEDLRARGADYLVIPSTAYWWLDHYPDLARHLRTRYPLITRLDDTCLVYALREAGANRLGAFLDSVLPEDAPVAVVSAGDDSALDVSRPAWHYPRDSAGAWAADRYGSGAEAAAELEKVRDSGTRFLVVAAEASGWLERYPDFLDQVEARFRRLASRQHLCWVFDLERSGGNGDEVDGQVAPAVAGTHVESSAKKRRGRDGLAAKLVKALPWERRAGRRRP